MEGAAAAASSRASTRCSRNDTSGPHLHKFDDVLLAEWGEERGEFDAMYTARMVRGRECGHTMVRVSVRGTRRTGGACD